MKTIYLICKLLLLALFTPLLLTCKKEVKEIPTVHITALTSVTTSSAICTGSISYVSSTPVTERGVCWSITQHPTTAGEKTSEGLGDDFVSVISGLAANTTYYLRAYAISVDGTFYSDEMILKTFTGTVSDVEGNLYNTVTIGTQLWMAENLKVTKFNDGTDIPLVTDDNEWFNATSSAYCWYDNKESNKNIYGALYKWNTVTAGKLAPVGWHVPGKEEWTTLINYLGGPHKAAYALKEAGTSHWRAPNTGATNSSGFSALPGGARGTESFEPNFSSGYGYWWNSTDTNSIELMGGYSDGFVSSLNGGQYWGFSVRCIKD